MINGISVALSALKAHSRKLGTAANHIANTRTPGFKKWDMSFQEMPPQNVSASSGISQVGRGVTTGVINEDFSPGSFESTSSSTDMAIGGNGFFMVRAPEGGD
jgi:flagellar hook protein FlgE